MRQLILEEEFREKQECLEVDLSGLAVSVLFFITTNSCVKRKNHLGHLKAWRKIWRC
jgi:hypothetical protein